jgi:hypothetical protein
MPVQKKGQSGPSEELSSHDQIGLDEGAERNIFWWFICFWWFSARVASHFRQSLQPISRVFIIWLSLFAWFLAEG